MDLERFQEFALQAAARHEVEIAEIRDSIRSLTNTVERQVDNQVFLQESMDLLTRKMIEETDLLTGKLTEQTTRSQLDEPFQPRRPLPRTRARSTIPSGLKGLTSVCSGWERVGPAFATVTQ